MEGVVVTVNPGVCGFDCQVKAEQSDKRNVSIKITESDCTMIQQLSRQLNDISLQDLFVPLTKNKIFIAAEKSGCHLACPIPAAVVKASEVALGLAVAKDVFFRIEK